MSLAPFTVESLLTDRFTEQEFRSLMWTKEPGLTHWVGGISTKKKEGYLPKVGVFWTPNPVKAPEFETTYSGQSWKKGEACWAGSDKIVQLQCCFSEMDTGTPEEQAQRIIDAIEKQGMPTPTAIVWSGGKSFHLDWLLTQDAMPRRSEWHEVQLAMIRAMGADPSITKYEQRMRYGCNKTRQAGPFEKGDVVRDQRVAYLGSPVELDALVAWARTVPLLPVEGTRETRTASGKRIPVKLDFSQLPHPLGGQGTLRQWAGLVTGKTQIPCPNPEHDDSTASAFAQRDRKGEVYIPCSVCEETFRDAGSLPSYDGFDENAPRHDTSHIDLKGVDSSSIAVESNPPQLAVTGGSTKKSGSCNNGTTTHITTTAFSSEGFMTPISRARGLYREATSDSTSVALSVVDPDTLDPFVEMSEEKRESLNADALARYKEAIGDRETCISGLRFSGPYKDGKAHSFFAAPCGKLSCAICSKRVPAALVSAMVAVVGSWDLVGDWTVGILEGKQQDIENVQRWNARAQRYNLRTITFMVSPTRSLTLCCWTTGGEPSTQLRKKILISNKSVIETAREIGAQFDTQAWTDKKGVKGEKSRYFRGEKSDLKLLSELRLTLLGLSQPGKKNSGWAPVWETPQETVVALNKEAKRRDLETTFELEWDRGYRIIARGSPDFPVHKTILEFGLETRVKPPPTYIDLDLLETA